MPHPFVVPPLYGISLMDKDKARPPFSAMSFLFSSPLRLAVVLIAMDSYKISICKYHLPETSTLHKKMMGSNF